MSHSALRTTAVLAVLVLAGCLGGPTAPSTDQSPTAPGVTPTPAPNETVAFPAGPKSSPEQPDDLTAATAADYAKRYEFRYSYNDLWDGPGTEVGLSEQSCSVQSTEEQADGYVVVVKCGGYVNRPADDSTATVHYDLAPWTVRYHVGDDGVRRTEVG